MNNIWDNKKIAEEIRNNGYYIFENYFNREEIDIVKKSLLDILHYIKPDEEKDLQKKYYQIKKYNSKLKGNWYDIAPYNITMLQLLHKPEMINFVKEFFNTDVVFSGRPAIHAHDDENDKLLEPHQERAQIARDNLVFWSSYPRNLQVFSHFETLILILATSHWFSLLKMILVYRSIQLIELVLMKN